MSSGVDRERLDRLRGDLAGLRERSGAAGDGSDGRGADGRGAGGGGAGGAAPADLASRRSGWSTSAEDEPEEVAGGEPSREPSREPVRERLVRRVGAAAEARARQRRAAEAERPADPHASDQLDDQVDPPDAPPGRRADAEPGGQPDAQPRDPQADQARDRHGAAHRSGTTADLPRVRFGRPRPPRPPRRHPFRRRARKPPRRLAVPTPIPVRRRPSWVAAPRWPTVGAVSGLVILGVMVPAVAQLAVRLLTAMEQTSFLLGADPTRTDALRAAAGVAGGGVTLALAILALAVVRGRPAYLSGAVAVLLVFVAFPWLAYRANAGIVAAPLPALGAMVTPDGWDHARELRAAFWLAAAAALAALGDLVWRSAEALGLTLRRRQGDRAPRR